MTRTRAANAAALPCDRRAFLGNSLALASAVAASAVAVPAVAAENPDAELVELGRRWEAARRDIDAFDDLPISRADLEGREEEIDAECLRLSDRENVVFNALMNRPAVSYAGLAIKARVADFEARLDSEHIAPGTMPDRALASLVADVERLAGQPIPVAPVAPVAAPALAAADAELLALRAPFYATLAALKLAGDAHTVHEEAQIARHRDQLAPDPAADRRCEAAERLMYRRDRANRDVVDRMIAIPARTVDGVAFKALASHKHENDLYPELVTSIMEDLIAMGGHDA